MINIPKNCVINKLYRNNNTTVIIMCIMRLIIIKLLTFVVRDILILPLLLPLTGDILEDVLTAYETVDLSQVTFQHRSKRDLSGEQTITINTKHRLHTSLYMCM